jgi:hypothetical protein
MGFAVEGASISEFFHKVTSTSVMSWFSGRHLENRDDIDVALVKAALWCSPLMKTWRLPLKSCFPTSEPLIHEQAHLRNS